MYHETPGPSLAGMGGELVLHDESARATDTRTMVRVTLAESIEALYRVFATYPRRDQIDACPHCVGREDADVLPRVPLSELSARDLGRYTFKAITTWGGTDDYRYFVPRILELSAAGAGATWPGLQLQHVAGKLLLGEWWVWPELERTTIRNFLTALWDAVLASDPDASHLRASEILPGIGRLVDVTPFLELWERDESLSSRLQLALLISSSWGDIANSRGPWRDAGRTVRRWLRDGQRRRALEDAFAQQEDGTKAKERFAAAIDSFHWMSAVGAMSTRDL